MVTWVVTQKVTLSSYGNRWAAGLTKAHISGGLMVVLYEAVDHVDHFRFFLVSYDTCHSFFHSSPLLMIIMIIMIIYDNNNDNNDHNNIMIITIIVDFMIIIMMIIVKIKLNFKLPDSQNWMGKWENRAQSI